MPRLAPVLAVPALAAVLAALPAAAAGTQAAAPPAPAEAEALAAPRPRSALSAERIYFLLTDRFANGDRANDRGGAAGGFAETGFGPTDPAAYHGGDLRGLTARLDHVRRLGATAIWVTPPFVQRVTQGATAGYHGYWGIDFTRVDPHLGTNDDFRRFVEAAHARGLKVFLDVVLNHTGDVIRYGGFTSGAPYVEQEDVPYRDTSGRPFDPARLPPGSPFPALHPDRRSFPYRPVLAARDRAVKRPAWLNDVRNYHNRGESTFQGESIRLGDFSGLDDLFTEKPDVREGLVELYAGWVREYRLDGFRVDTARHVEDAFWRLFVPAMRIAAREAGVEDFSLFGEVFDAAGTSRYVRRGLLPATLDFSFQQAALPYAAGASTGADLAALYDQDDLYTTASSTAYDLPTFLGNHDLGRIGYSLAQPGISGPDALAAALLANDLMFLTRGAPVVYYGDEAGMTGSVDGRDRYARQDMFPTRVEAWRTERRIGSAPVGGGDSFDLSHPIARRIALLSRLVERHPALRNGAQLTRVAAAGVFATSRIDAADRREYVVALNNGRAAASVSVPTSTPDASFARLWPLEGDGPRSGADGRLRLTVPARSAVVVRAEERLPEARPPRVSLRAPRLDPFLGGFRLQSDVPGADPATVTFAIRSAGTQGWVRVGTDDARPFRLVLEEGRFVRGRPVSVVAIARSSSGAVATSQVRVLRRP